MSTGGMWRGPKTENVEAMSIYSKVKYQPGDVFIASCREVSWTESCSHPVTAFSGMSSLISQENHEAWRMDSAQLLRSPSGRLTLCASTVHASNNRAKLRSSLTWLWSSNLV